MSDLLFALEGSPSGEQRVDVSDVERTVLEDLLCKTLVVCVLPQMQKWS